MNVYEIQEIIISDRKSFIDTTTIYQKKIPLPMILLFKIILFQKINKWSTQLNINPRERLGDSYAQLFRL